MGSSEQSSPGHMPKQAKKRHASCGVTQGALLPEQLVDGVDALTTAGLHCVDHTVHTGKTFSLEGL